MPIELDPPFVDMLENFLAAKEKMPSGQKSDHWNVFPGDFERAITNTEAWPYFLRNSLSAGFNDDLHWAPNGNLASGAGANTPWDRRKRYDFSPLLPETISQQDHLEGVKKLLQAKASVCGIEFVLSNLATNTGSPSTISLNIQANDSKQVTSYQVGYFDLSLIYYCWQISRITKAKFEKLSTIVEIGGGFGGFIAKMKNLFPESKCIIFDLPEVNAVQTYYLTQRFPKAHILGFKDFILRGPAIFEDIADFLILPGWLIEGMSNDTVDLVVNTRSMMEMTPDIIDFYFTHIQNIVPVGGLFACYNRYTKLSNFKNYPYDNRWRILSSQTNDTQPHIHELTVERTEIPENFPVKDALMSLPPYS